VGTEIAAKQFMAELEPWIEREKAEHIKRIVAIAKRGFRRIEKLWDENAVPEARAESLTAATLDKHDAIIRRNLGMSETSAGSAFGKYDNPGFQQINLDTFGRPQTIFAFSSPP
jgi:hypothetical protein